MHGIEELAQSAKGLLHRHEDWSLVARTHVEKLDAVALGRWRQGSLVFSQAGTMGLRPIKDSVSKHKGGLAR